MIALANVVVATIVAGTLVVTGVVVMVVVNFAMLCDLKDYINGSTHIGAVSWRPHWPP